MDTSLERLYNSLIFNVILFHTADLFHLFYHYSKHQINEEPEIFLTHSNKFLLPCNVAFL